MAILAIFLNRLLDRKSRLSLTGFSPASVSYYEISPSLLRLELSVALTS
jgi:hypothetical protein